MRPTINIFLSFKRPYDSTKMNEITLYHIGLNCVDYHVLSNLTIQSKTLPYNSNIHKKYIILGACVITVFDFDVID